MWYLIVSIPDLCTLTYFVWVFFVVFFFFFFFWGGGEGWGGGYIIMLYFKGSQVGISQFGICQACDLLKYIMDNLIFIAFICMENPSEYKGSRTL